MNLRRISLACGTALGLLLGAASFGFGSDEDLNQCYYDPEIDAPGSCTACGQKCLGAGYRCCKIVVIDNPLPQT